MQFKANGPDIPNSLLQAHEEGRVVFFCGAGISYPAGLPGFKGLVDEIYRSVGTSPTAIERETYDRSQFDATLDLLERRLPGQRIAVRSALVKALQPKLRRKGATDTHAALLQLARCREGSLRLVTTNFDRIFERVAKKNKLVINPHSAPMLPIPKNSRWNGLVYLHGLLPDKVDENALHRLVFTSGDFGLAYLTERWAARFVSELFRNYVVCFVGYSINDPVLRYMMDALAADRMQGETTPQAYALGDFESGQEQVKNIEWKAKGVTPVLYEVRSGSHDHTGLHSTLKAWAETYRDGVLGRERIVVDNALAHPSASSQQDDFVGRMLWGLSDESGLPVRRFADFNPVPTLAWLEVFSKRRFQYDDLGCFGVSPSVQGDAELRFSLLQRPSTYANAQWMSLIHEASTGTQWDNVMPHLARWLVRHMNDPALIIWLAQRGGQLHERFRWLVETELERFVSLEHENNTTELDEIRSNAPNAIPCQLMQIPWRLLLAGCVKSQWRVLDLHSWTERLKRDGLTTTLRFELRDMLAPKVIFKKPFRWGESDEGGVRTKHLKQLVDWELALAADDVHFSLNDLTGEHWRVALPRLLDDFQLLLRDALDLLQELGAADDRRDLSIWDMPSVYDHWQNRHFKDWVVLIELLRDAWLQINSDDPKRAAQVAQSWFDIPYPTFKRLALFAAGQNSCIPPEQWVEWLVADDAWWLWSVETKRETMRLLVLQGARIPQQSKVKLESTILVGPPRALYRNDLEPERWQSSVDRSIWLRLAKLQEGGAKLGAVASQQFIDLSSENSEWALESSERDEFSHWMSGTGDPDYEECHHIDIAPRKRRELVTWLKQPLPVRNSFSEGAWREICSTRFFHAICALYDLGTEDTWPAERWREALHVWAEESKVLRSWRFAAPVLKNMPNEVIQEIEASFTWWLEAVSKSIDGDEAILLEFCRRILTLSAPDTNDNEQPVTGAINHSIRHVTQVMLNLLFKRKPNDNDGLPRDIKPFLIQLCDPEVEHYRHGRVILASQLITLFRVDRRWTEEYLLPLFDWAINPSEAKAAWEGFLWSPRLYRPLLIEFKPQFLETANHYTELGDYSNQYAAFLTYAALGQVDGYTDADFQIAVGALQQDGLQRAAKALSQALESAGEQREIYWRNRIQPFWQHVWPKSLDFTSQNISTSLARMSISANSEFPAALSAVAGWLQPIDHPHSIVYMLRESDLARRFPVDALCLLNAILENQPSTTRDLIQCLDTISDADPTLVQDPRYQRLRIYSRQHG